METMCSRASPRMDRQYPDDFRRDRIRGYAAEHTLTMKLAEPATQ